MKTLRTLLLILTCFLKGRSWRRRGPVRRILFPVGRKVGNLAPERIVQAARGPGYEMGAPSLRIAFCRNAILGLAVVLLALAWLGRGHWSPSSGKPKPFVITREEWSELSPQDQEDPYVLMHLEADHPAAPMP